MRSWAILGVILFLATVAGAQSNCPTGGTILSIPSSVTGTITIGSCKQGSEYHDIYHIPNLAKGRQLRFVVTKTTLPDLHFEITYVTDFLTIVDIYNHYEYFKNSMTVDIEIPVATQINIFVAGATSYSTGGYTLAVSDLSVTATGTPQIVPVVGHLSGVGGSAFRSDLKLYNPTSSVMTGKLIFTPRGQSQSTQDPSVPFHIPSMGVSFYPDVYLSAFPGGAGAARLVIQPDSLSLPIVDSSTYTALPDTGELAQSPTILLPTSFRAGVEVAVLGKSGERTNILVMTGSQDAVIYWKYRDQNGTVLGTSAKSYSHDATYQFAVSDLFGLTPVANGSIEATIQSGTAWLALSPVNNVSNQGRWLDFQPVPQ
jgi:hypothetical protein